MTFYKIVRAMLVGVCAYWLLGHIPALAALVTQHLGNHGSVDEDDEPIYRDKDGKGINFADHQLLVGYETAQQRNFGDHEACRSLYAKPEDGLKRMGCSRFVSSKKVQPPHVQQGNWDGGKTTAECEAEVNAYWRVVIQDLNERGDDRAAGTWTRKSWAPELAECKNYDNVRIGKVIFEPLVRLRDILGRVDRGEAWTAQDREVIERDIEQVRAFPEHEARDAYLREAGRFFRIVEGTEKPKTPPPLLLSCDELKRKIEEFQQAEKQDSEAQAALKRDGVTVDARRFAALNQARLDRLWALKRHMDGAQAAGCAIPGTAL